MDAAAICQTACPEAQFVFVGGGLDLDRLQERAQTEKLVNVKFIPQQSMQAMSGILPHASALLVQLKSDPLFAITIPSKIQAYLACGRPIIIAANGNAADLVIAAEAGIVIPPESPTALVQAVKRISLMSEEERAALGSNGQRFYKSELSMAVGVAKFEEVFNLASGSNQQTLESDYIEPNSDRQFVQEKNILQPRSSDLYLKFGKRLLDLILVVPALVLLLPVFIIISLMSAYDLGFPVTFKQLRAGKGGKLFYIRKFRSMTSERDAQGELLPDAVRTTKYGAFLRKSSLDELPGLINVLLGDMSLVGPRPLLPEYIPYYSSHHARRHDVLPGITGPAQINGRQLLTFSARMEMDVWYVESVSLGTDVRLILKTIPKVLRSKGVVTGQDVREVDDLGLSKESRERFQQSIG